LARFWRWTLLDETAAIPGSTNQPPCVGFAASR